MEGVYVVDGIKTDLFPENLRAAKNDMGKQETGVGQENRAGSMKAESGYKDTMTPEEPLPETEHKKDTGSKEV